MKAILPEESSLEVILHHPYMRSYTQT